MFIPQVLSMLTIELPGEALRAMVERVVSSDSIVARIVSQPMAKSHSYKKDDIVACRRQKAMMGEVWAAIDERREPVKEAIVKEEKNAAGTGEQSKNNKPKHKRANAQRKSSKKPSADSSHSVGKRQKASKGK